MKFKTPLVLLLSFGILTTSILNLGTAQVKASTETLQNVIYDYVSDINSKNWDNLINIQSDNLNKSLVPFIKNKSNEQQKNGIFDIKSATVEEIKPIPSKEVSKFIKVDKYADEYKNLQCFLVGIYYNVYTENKYYVNGVNYDLVIIGKQENQYKIIDGMMAPIDLLREDGYGFFNKNEDVVLNVIKQRREGNIINQTGKLLGTIKTENSTKTINNRLGYNFNIAFPEVITVGITSSGSRSNVLMYNYIQDVLPNEWYTSWNKESLKAGAVAIKMYAWFHVYYPNRSAQNMGVDVLDNTDDQVYKYNSNNSTTNAACCDVYHTAIVNSSGNVFNTEYRAWELPQGGGILSQKGSQRLASNGYSYFQILTYYYGNISTRVIPKSSDSPY